MSIPEPLLSETLPSPALSVPAPLVAPPGTALPGEYVAGRWVRSRARVRGLVLAALLFLVPLIAYWPTTFHDYGLRDDYSNLREAHEEPGKVVDFCASHARPIYGWLLQSTYGLASTVQSLEWLRLGACLLLGAIAYGMCRGLHSLGWAFEDSLCAALLIALVPSAQVIAAWAVGWPYAVTALLALGAFFVAESGQALAARGDLGRALGSSAVALGLMVICALIYQSSAMFYVVPLAGALIAERRRSLGATVRWAGAHLTLVMLSLGLAYLSMTSLYAHGVFEKSARVAFEHDWGAKIDWLLSETLPNALSLFVLNDDHHRDRALYLGCAALVALVLLAGAALEWRRHGRTRGLVWLTGLIFLPIAAFSVSMVASERYATYRTILAMTAVLVCFLIASIRALTAHLTDGARGLLLTLLLATAFLTAQRHAYALIAVPQGNEWQLIVSGAKQVHLNQRTPPRVFAIASRPDDISTSSIYHDEFGSLSSNSEWVPKEMFKRAMHDLHPGIAGLDSRYEFATGPKVPAGQRFDVVIDMRRLRQFYLDN